MALRKPLVIIAGDVQELPVGDTIPGGSGGSSALGNLISFATSISILASYQYHIVDEAFILGANGDLQIQGEVIITA